jgi:hypothetical protein
LLTAVGAPEVSNAARVSSPNSYGESVRPGDIQAGLDEVGIA